MKATAIALVAAAAISPSYAFAPSSNGGGRVSTSVSATYDRRDAMGNIAKTLMGVAILAAGADPAFAASNPASWESSRCIAHICVVQFAYSAKTVKNVVNIQM